MIRAISFTIFATFLGQALNFFTDILIASNFGTSWKADAYFLALLIPMIVSDLFIVGINSVFIPTYMTYRKNGAGERLFNSVASATFIIAICIGMTLLFLSPSIINLIARNFSSEARILTIRLTRLLLFILATMPFGVVLSNTLNAHNHFTLPAMGKAITFLCMILSIFFFKRLLDIYSLVFGFIAGSVVFIMLQLFILHNVGIRYSAIIDVRHPAMKEISVLLLPLMAASLANYVNIFVERSVAASFSEGSIAALNYAFKVINIPVNMLILAAMTVILPTFSKHVTEGDIKRLNELAIKGLNFISFVMVPLVAGMIIFRVPLIKLFFERGEFTGQSTELTSTALLFYSFGILGLSAVSLMSRVFYALKDIKTLSKIGIGAIVINILLILILSKGFGFIGIPLTFSITYTIHITVMLIVLEKRLGASLTMPFLKTFLKHSLASGIMTGACLVFISVVGYNISSSTIGLLLYLFFATTFGGLSYVASSSLFRVKEVELVFDTAKSLTHRLRVRLQERSVL